MSQTKKVILYGGSLFINGLSISLSAIPNLEVKRMEAQIDDDLEWVRTEAPDVIIAELGIATGTMAPILIKKYPGVTLIGLDTECNRLLVFSIKQQIALAANDLVKVIQTKNPD